MPEMYAGLLRAARFPAAVARLGTLDVSIADLAATMVAEENRPMYANSCRVPDDVQRVALAEATLAAWDSLRSEA